MLLSKYKQHVGDIMGVAQNQLESQKLLLQKSAELSKENNEKQETLHLLTELLHKGEWDKIKSSLRTAFNLLNEHTQSSLPELFAYVHLCAAQLISHKEIDTAEDFYLLFLTYIEKLSASEIYCSFLQTIGDQFFKAHYYEIALPYYTLALNFAEKSAKCHTLLTIIIEQINLIELNVRQRILENLAEQDITRNVTSIKQFKDSGFWLHQRTQLNILRNNLQIPTINNLSETNKFNFLQQWNDEFKVFLQNSIKTIVSHLGTPPCLFSFVLTGSYGRGDGAIYSDIDPVILIQPQSTLAEEEKMRMHPYFAALIHYLCFHLASLGDPWLLGKNKKKRIFCLYQGLHLDYTDLNSLIHEDASQRYLIQTPQALATWIIQGFYADVDEFQCTSYGLQWTQFLYQSDEKTNLYDDYLSALNAQSLHQYTTHCIKFHQKQFKKPLRQSWISQPNINLKMRFICPLIYMCWDITLAKCTQPYQSTNNSIVLHSLATWRQQKFLSSSIINLIESAFIFLHALKFEGQLKRNGQPDLFLFPHITPNENDYDKSGISLHCLPQINEEQFYCLAAIDALIQICYDCMPNIILQPNNAEFDPIKHMINYALPTNPNRWLPLLATFFIHYFTQTSDYLPYYRLIPDHHRATFLDILQQRCDANAKVHSILEDLYQCPKSDGYKPTMLHAQQQWRHQLLNLFQRDVTDKQLQEAKNNGEWLISTYDLENYDHFQLKSYLLHQDITKHLLNDDGSFKQNETTLSIKDCQLKLVVKIAPKLPAIANGVHYLSSLLCGGGAPEDLICHFQRGNESQIVQIFSNTYIPTKISEEDFASLDLMKLWQKFFTHLDDLSNFYQSLFPPTFRAAQHQSASLITVPFTEKLVIALWERSNNLQFTVKLALLKRQAVIDLLLQDKINHDLINYFQSQLSVDKIHAEDVILYPKQALEVLVNLENEQLMSITNLIKSGHADGFLQFQLLNSRLQLNLIDNVLHMLDTRSHSHNENQQNEQWDEPQLRNLLTAMKGVFFTKLNLSHFAQVITDEMLLSIIQGAGHYLLELNLSDCNNISENTINDITLYCPKLRTLIINKWSGKSFILIDVFPQLRYLEINACTNLTRIQLKAPHLSTLHAQNNAALVALKFKTRRLKKLNLMKCTTLSEQALMNCLPNFSTLVQVTLKGCKQIHHISFRERYPYLLGQSFNKHKGRLKENLKIDYRIYRKHLSTIYHKIKNLINRKNSS